jgi:hypothetical protein
LVAQHARRKNAEQTVHRMRARVQNGYAVFQAAVGYKYVKQPGTSGKTLVLDEPVASVVRGRLKATHRASLNRRPL